MIRQKKQKKEVAYGLANIVIKSTFNNTIITVSDLSGNTLCWSSPGVSGFKGTRKSTSYAAQKATKDLILKIIELGVKKIVITIKGRGAGREACLRSLIYAGFQIISIKDKTALPYNGCRPPKKRRL